MHSVIDPYRLLLSIFCTLPYTASLMLFPHSSCWSAPGKGIAVSKYNPAEKCKLICQTTGFVSNSDSKAFKNELFHLDWDPGPLRQKKYLHLFVQICYSRTFKNDLFHPTWTDDYFDPDHASCLLQLSFYMFSSIWPCVLALAKHRFPSLLALKNIHTE